jgi:DNA-directed RNA polymerase subunit H (RpoH/RPB5)
MKTSQRTNVTKMLLARGDLVDPEPRWKKEGESWRALLPHFELIASSPRYVVVYTPSCSAPKLSNLQAWAEELQEAEGHRVILVSDVITNPAKAKLMVEFFETLFFHRNLVDSNLVVPHTPVDVATTGFLKGDLPIIKQSDPVCRYYGYRVGDVLKIERGYPDFSIAYKVVCC